MSRSLSLQRTILCLIFIPGIDNIVSSASWTTDWQALSNRTTMHHGTLQDNLAHHEHALKTNIQSIMMSLMAGLSTVLGALVVFIMPGNRVPPGQLAFSLALAAGVMVCVSVLEFWWPGLTGKSQLKLYMIVVYSGMGAAAFLLLARALSQQQRSGSEECHNNASIEMKVSDLESQEDHHPFQEGRDVSGPVQRQGRQMKERANSFDAPEDKTRGRSSRLAMVMMLSLTLHNFPEGFAVAVSAFESDRLGVVVMIAIAVHNIPEGIAIAVPVLDATGSKKRALLMSFLSGIAEPIGAFTAIVFLNIVGVFSESAIESLLCTVAGVMFAAAASELLPGAWELQHPTSTVIGFIVGLIAMALTIQMV